MEERERGQVVEGGEAFRSTKKKVFVHGFVNEKNDARRRALKIYVSALALKNILARIYINGKKNSYNSKIPYPFPPTLF